MDVLLIKGGTVENCISADSVARAQLFFRPADGWLCIERAGPIAQVGPGWTTADGGQTFAAPPVPPPDLRITRYAFLRRFSDGEAVAIDLASQGATVQAASMRRYMSLINTAQWIDLADPATRGGVQALEGAGLLAPGRAVQILDGPVLDDERPDLAVQGAEA